MNTHRLTRTLARIGGVGVIGIASLGMSACDNAGQGALSGAAIGAGGGAIIGSIFGAAGTGAAVGAAGGAIGGAVVGDQNERRANESRYQQRRDW